MKNEKMNKVMNTMMAISALAVLGGALLMIWHYSIGSSIFWWGIISYSILSSMEISRLKKIIAKSRRLVNPDELAI